MQHKQTLTDKQVNSDQPTATSQTVQTNLCTLSDTWLCDASLKSWLIDQTLIITITGDREIIDTLQNYVAWCLSV